ncbi:hypothetical protein TNCV_2218601 [Trichonephila clavipes]|nr:hypothetical protein TNCV_2218601 [Trichonephila clavipes]
MVKRIARKHKHQFFDNRYRKNSGNNSSSTPISECTASSSKLGNDNLSTVKTRPGPVFGNRFIDFDLIVDAFAQLCCPKSFTD